MQVEILVGEEGICLVLSPVSALEEELLKALVKQDNTMQQARSGITVFNKTLANALVITKKSVLEPCKKHAVQEEIV